MPTVDKMVGENKGKKGKEPRSSCGIIRKSTHEYGRNNNNIVTKKILIASWKGNKREKRKKVTFERSEKVEYIW